ncbi:MAG TPA: FtsW/RodA/SpoVE family cell cycle protein [Clostridia bacterium]|nr:FtsW/RodA/SpoVE family cell cycle protein [Clostridia bacterium]
MKAVGRVRPVYLIILVDAIGFGLLYFYKKPYDNYILLAGLAAILLITLGYLAIKLAKLGDGYLFLIAGMLSSIGIIMLYRLDRELGFKQIIWFAAGIIMFFISCLLFRALHIWERLVYCYPLASLLLFAVTLVFGRSIKGARNWILIGQFSVQPSEFIKILFVFFAAGFLSRYEGKLDEAGELRIGKLGIRPVFVLMGISFMHLGFMVVQQEWGTALMIFLVYFMLFYVFINKRIYLIINAVLAVMGGTAGALFVNHVRIRVDTWIDPWKDIAGKGYQITQSLFAIGAGGFFGTGLGLGRPDYIPEVETDFIFSAVCEEMGIFGGVAIVLLYFILTYRGFKIALSIKDQFMKILAFGITLIFGFQTFIIVGGVIKLIPLSGITLPFISYGGSSLLVSYISMGILQAISAGPSARRAVAETPSTGNAGPAISEVASSGSGDAGSIEEAADAKRAGSVAEAGESGGVSPSGEEES